MSRQWIGLMLSAGLAASMTAACLAGDAPGEAPATFVPWDRLGSFAQLAQADGVEPMPATRAGPPGEAEAPATRPFGLDYVSWDQRRGPAYPQDKWHSVGRDLKELPETLWDDTKHALGDPVFLGGMVAAGVAGIAINATGVDETVADRTDGHRQLCKEADGIGGFFGSPAFHFPLAAGMYAAGLAGDDLKLYETSKTLFNALAINSATVSLLKLAVRSESPNGDENGWPSGHTSSSFCVATVMHEAYGPRVGVPLFAFAGFVGYERIDARNHDFSDVISGMIMGIVIGHSVSRNHEARILGMQVEPWLDPQSSTVGLVLSRRW